MRTMAVSEATREKSTDMATIEMICETRGDTTKWLNQVVFREKFLTAKVSQVAIYPPSTVPASALVIACNNV